MRIRVAFQLTEPTPIPFNHQEFLAAAIYRLLETSDTEYARFLHDEGYAIDDGPKRFKLFTFSWLRGRRLGAGSEGATFAPGVLEWFVTSPVEDFVRNMAVGLLAAGHVQVGRLALPVQEVQTLPAAEITQTMRLTCLSPIVASVPGERSARYLRAGDAVAMSEAVRKNLVRKHLALYGKPPLSDSLVMEFDPAYISRHKEGGSKKITVHGIDVIGVMAPLTLSGSPELIALALECGLGEKNSSGFGMVDVVR